MNKKKYYEYIKSIIESPNLTEKDATNLLRLVELLRVIGKNDPKDIEDQSYKIGDAKLSENEKIIYELNYLYDTLKEEKDTESLIKKIAYQMKEDNSSNDYDPIKEQITMMQLDNDITPRFYSVFDSIINKNLQKKNIDFNEEDKVAYKRGR